jgi:mevalonate kinase
VITKQEKKMIEARAPGKLILSGEHAVVFGKQAIAMAVDRFATVSISKSPDKHFHFDLKNFNKQLNYSFDQLRNLRESKRRAYGRFLNNELTINDVLPNMDELIPFSLTTVFEYMTLSSDSIKAMDCSMKIDIPVGCGMGSSAAAGLAVIKAVDAFLHSNMSTLELFEASMECERLIAGHPSGVDTYVSLHGGTINYRPGNVIPIKNPNWPFALYDTGRPITSTGECVVTVQKSFADSKIWDEFDAISGRITELIESDWNTELRDLFRINNELLCRIGVVPESIQSIIKTIESVGGAAKICGAGAVRGDKAGVIIGLGDFDIESFNNEDSKLLNCQMCNSGTQITEIIND